MSVTVKKNKNGTYDVIVDGQIRATMPTHTQAHSKAKLFRGQIKRGTSHNILDKYR